MITLSLECKSRAFQSIGTEIILREHCTSTYIADLCTRSRFGWHFLIVPKYYGGSMPQLLTVFRANKKPCQFRQGYIMHILHAFTGYIVCKFGKAIYVGSKFVVVPTKYLGMGNRHFQLLICFQTLLG